LIARFSEACACDATAKKTDPDISNMANFWLVPTFMSKVVEKVVSPQLNEHLNDQSPTTSPVGLQEIPFD